MVAKNLTAGICGAIALNILHESLKKTHPKMPRIDLLGEEALQKVLSKFGAPIESENKLYAATLGADLVSNGLYYSLIGAGKKKNIWPNAIGLGLAAGIGALVLPKPLGLDPEPVSHTTTASVLTVGYYFLGAIVTAAILDSRPKAIKFPRHGSE